MTTGYKAKRSWLVSRYIDESIKKFKSPITMVVPNGIVKIIFNYFYIGDHWDVDFCGDLISINGIVANRIVKNNIYHSYCSVYGKVEVTSGEHIWRIKIIKRDPGGVMVIGIGSCYYKNTYFYNSGKPLNYVYALNLGAKTSHHGGWIDYPSSSNKRYCGTGDIVTVHLNLNEKTIGFSKNDQFIAIAFKNIDTTVSYRLGVTMESAGQCVQMLSAEHKH